MVELYNILPINNYLSGGRYVTLEGNKENVGRSLFARSGDEDSIPRKTSEWTSCIINQEEN